MTDPELTPEQRTAYYRWEFFKWHQTEAPGCGDCKGAAAISTNRRATWVCSNCGKDVSIMAAFYLIAILSSKELEAKCSKTA